MLVCFYASQCISFKKEIMIDVFLRNRYTSWFHSVDPVSMRQWSAVTVVWNAHWEGNQAVVQRRRLGPLHHQGANLQEAIGSVNSQSVSTVGNRAALKTARCVRDSRLSSTKGPSRRIPADGRSRDGCLVGCVACRELLYLTQLTKTGSTKIRILYSGMAVLPL